MKPRMLRSSLLAIGLLLIPASAQAGSQISKTLKLNPGGHFVLEADQGSVSVTGTDQTGANIVITSNRDDLSQLFDFSFEEEPGGVRIRARRRDFWDWFWFTNVHFEIWVPKTTSLEIRTAGGGISTYSLQGDAELRTSGGSIEVWRLRGKLRALTSGGSVHVRDVQGDAELGTSGGGIEADSVDGWLMARTSGGSIRIDRATGRVEARTSGGSVHATFSGGNSHGGVVETSGGSIDVRLDPAANLEIEASTSGGGVSSSLPIHTFGTYSSHELRGTLGTGGETLHLHTSGGSIRLSSL